MATTAKPQRPHRRITAIGSLPHHNVDAALAYSLRFGIPFLPEIPIRNPWEYMIASALEGLPGLQAERDGVAQLDLEIWRPRRDEFERRLKRSFRAEPGSADALAPSSVASSCWLPFLWELEEAGVTRAKVQIAGPLTAGWSLRLTDRKRPARDPGPGGARELELPPELSSQIFGLVLSRALAMVRELRARSIMPLVYLDEPGLYGFLPKEPRHRVALEELRLTIQALRKEGAQVGLHCCSNTDWASLLTLPVHYLSLDTGMSLDNLLSRATPDLKRYLKDGGKLSLGAVPSRAETGSLQDLLDPKRLFQQLLETFARHWSDDPAAVRAALADSLLTPACGLALQTPADCEAVLASLTELHDLLEASFPAR
jgi:hypothetical protein